MWRPWAKSPVKIHDTSSQFSCSSFKDIQNLCIEDPNPYIPSASTKKPSIFHRVRLASSLIRSWAPRPSDQEPESTTNSASDYSNINNTETLQPPQQDSQPPISIPGAEKRIVVYFTSLRVVRSTFEDCRSVRSILRGFRVPIDERDLSMDSGFLNELQGILGGGGQSKLTLPRVFIGGRYIGGAEEIRQLHEAGELKKFVEGLPTADSGVCDVCGGYSFVLCNECDGSHKLYTQKAGGFKCCTICNENGLIRCPSCSYAPFSSV